MRYYIVDAFTEKPFGGNTAGVVLIEDGKEFPSDEFMQQVAAEFRYSETATSHFREVRYQSKQGGIQ